ncbi:MAG TPA: hypothetical protein VKZ18_21330, partial [Polyangia bacterium]|nr:hypothetical protein [Polyangia bacterium]
MAGCRAIGGAGLRRVAAFLAAFGLAAAGCGGGTATRADAGGAGHAGGGAGSTGRGGAAGTAGGGAGMAGGATIVNVLSLASL